MNWETILTRGVFARQAERCDDTRPPTEVMTTSILIQIWRTPAIQNKLSDLCFLVAKRCDLSFCFYSVGFRRRL